MSTLSLIENKEKIIQKDGIGFNWQDSSSVQRLLDVITSIIAEEYITVAKQNPEVFSKIASPPSLDFDRDKSGARNDTEKRIIPTITGKSTEVKNESSNLRKIFF